MRPDLAHLVSFLCVMDGVESGLGVVGDGVFSGDDGVAGLDVDGSVAVWCLTRVFKLTLVVASHQRATARSALLTCSLMPRNVRRARLARYW